MYHIYAPYQMQSSHELGFDRALFFPLCHLTVLPPSQLASGILAPYSHPLSLSHSHQFKVHERRSVKAVHQATVF